MHNTLCNNNHKNCIASKLLDNYNLTLDKSTQKDEVLHILDDHIQAMIYNVASIASVTALLDEKSKIEMKHIDFIKHYITKQCTKHVKNNVTNVNQQGGGSFPAEYFGYDSGAYTEANYGGVNYTDSVWNGSDAAIRQAIPMTGGSSKIKDIVINNKEVAKYIKTVISFNDVKISKPALSEILKLVNIHLNCIGDDLQKYENLKPSLLDKIFKNKKHAVFK